MVTARILFLQALLAFSLSLPSHNALAAESADILTMGDSLTAGLFRASNGVITCAAQGGRIIAADQQRSCRGDGREGVGGWQPSLKSLVSTDVFNFGNTGEFTSEMVARIGQALNARNSAYVLILGGTNDVIRGVPRSTTIANLNSLINRVKADGRVPIIGTIPPLLGSYFAGRNSAVVQLNDAIRQIADVKIVDHYASLVDAWSLNNSGDFIHLGGRGNTIVAQGWFAGITEPAEQDVIIAPIIKLLVSNR